MRSGRLCLWAALGLLAASDAPAVDRPVAVSPGSESGTRIQDLCPTFSWGSTATADAYELVVYRIEDARAAAEVVLRRRLPGSTLSWTPSLDRCLERGGRYAWSLRATEGPAMSEWSIPSLFEVTTGPSREQFEAALGVVRSYLEVEGGGQAPGGPEKPLPGDSSSGAAGPQDRLDAASQKAEGSAGASGRTHQGSGSSIVVDGARVETRADPPCYPSSSDPQKNHRYVDCGNGTVLDTVTGLLWLEDANCPFRPAPFPDSGNRDWYQANAFAAQLESGLCDLTDHSQPGDWRLATAAEWEATIAQAKVYGCTDGGAGSPPALTNDPATNCLSAGPTSFVNVGFFYWTSTTDDGGAATQAVAVSLNNGNAGATIVKTDTRLVWPVRDGR